MSEERMVSAVPSDPSAPTLDLAEVVLEMDMRLLFLLIVSAFALQTWYVNSVLLTDSLFYQSFAGQLTIGHIDELLRFWRRYAWFSYALIPVVVLIRVGFTAVCLLIGTVLLDYEMKFSRSFRVALTADIAFVAAAYAKAIWLGVTGVETIIEVSSFTPLSLFAAVGAENVAPWLIYPLQVANAFEVVYCFLLALGLRWALRRPFSAMLKLVAGSYGVGLLLLVMGVVFIAVNLG